MKWNETNHKQKPICRAGQDLYIYINENNTETVYIQWYI